MIEIYEIYEWILFDFDFWSIWKLGGRQQIFSLNLHTFVRRVIYVEGFNSKVEW